METADVLSTEEEVQPFAAKTQLTAKYNNNLFNSLKIKSICLYLWIKSQPKMGGI